MGLDLDSGTFRSVLSSTAISKSLPYRKDCFPFSSVLLVSSLYLRHQAILSF